MQSQSPIQIKSTNPSLADTQPQIKAQFVNSTSSAIQLQSPLQSKLIKAKPIKHASPFANYMPLIQTTNNDRKFEVPEFYHKKCYENMSWYANLVILFLRIISHKIKHALFEYAFLNCDLIIGYKFIVQSLFERDEGGGSSHKESF